MPAQVKKIDGLTHQLTVTVPAEQVESAYQKHLKEAAKLAKVPGFREGKVPETIVAQKHGKGIRQDAINEVMQKAMSEAINEHKLQIAGQPVLESMKADVGQPLEFVVKIETYPEIKVNNLANVKIDRLKAEIAAGDIDKMLETLRKQNAEWVETDRASKVGDRVQVDFEGTIDGKPFQGNKAEKFQLELGSGQMIPGFEDGIVGMKAGDERMIHVNFPSEYPAEEVKGKHAHFNIVMHKVLEPKLPALDEEFAKKMGFQAVDSMRDEVKKSMEDETARVLKQRLKLEVLDKLLEKNKLDTPKALVEQEIHHLQGITRRQMAQQYGEQASKMELPHDPYRAEAEKRVKLGLLLGEVIKENKLAVNAADIDKKIEELAQHYQDPQQVVAWYHNNKQMMGELHSAMLEEQAVDLLLKDMQISDKTVSYEDALKQTQEHEKE